MIGAAARRTHVILRGAARGGAISRYYGSPLGATAASRLPFYHGSLFFSTATRQAADDYGSGSDDFDNFHDFDEDRLEDDETIRHKREVQERQRKAAELHEEFKKRKGRLWTDPWDLNDMLDSNYNTADDLPDWEPKYVSRISQERVKLYDKEGCTIPTMEDLAQLALPKPPPPHPGMAKAKAYALWRKRAQLDHVRAKVNKLAKHKVAAIQKLTDWQDKQDAVDVLFEDIEATLKEQEVILGRHPKFGEMVERALEEYLKSVQKATTTASDEGEKQAQAVETATTVNNDNSTTANKNESKTSNANADTETSPQEDKIVPESTPPVPIDDADAEPIFMDCYDAEKDSEEKAVPHLVIPLKATTERLETAGRMIEEWELAAHKTTKRIMLRQCTRKIARAITESDTAARILVTGVAGVGKSAAMVAIVAMARYHGGIVLYLPEGDQFHRNFFYIVPNAKRDGIYDLPVLTQQVCQQLLDCHKEDLVDFEADPATIEKFFTKYEREELLEGYEEGKSMSTVDLLNEAVRSEELAPMCYSTVIDVLMNQDRTPFYLVFDEGNCLFEDPTRFFHEEYDFDVKKSIPHGQISLFSPFLDALSLTAKDEIEDVEAMEPVLMKKGAVICGITESHAVPRRVTDNLVRTAKNDPSLHVVDVPRLSKLEFDHMVAHYETVGVGKCRLDRGETVMNEEEMEYLRMVSGAIPLRLMDACILE